MESSAALLHCSTLIAVPVATPPTIHITTLPPHSPHPPPPPNPPQLAQPDAIALGGGTGFALRIDGDLKWGASRASTTFKNPSLSAAEDFMVDCLELWWLSRI